MQKLEDIARVMCFAGFPKSEFVSDGIDRIRIHF